MTTALPRKTANVILHDGPFGREQRQTDLDNTGVPPKTLHILDAVATMTSVVSGQPGEEIPLHYELYERTHRTEAGIWVYMHIGSSSGRFTVAG